MLRVVQTYNEHRSWVLHSRILANTVVTGSRDGDVRMWDARMPRSLTSWEISNLPDVTTLNFHPAYSIAAR